ncbi:hypothetical protein PBY51_023921 [Eleginops maclovinus]|uniref:MADF domain-containing protein n=1 Tax=Eleginops maclovinus TaxID=56733 RepID=A0AAN7WVF5_ELEMC|nr:hypothetical protein PBY51_023921 [Eleginops maclovinus]
MEVPLFSFTAERYWTEEKERALIAFFSKHSCLWNHRSESYKNRQLRWKTLEHLRVLLSAHPPPVPLTVEDIKNKFKNLRTTFQRQYKIVKASAVCGSDDVLVPQWKHYQQLLFLQGCWEQEGGAEVLRSPLTTPQEESQPPLSPPLILSFLPTTSTSPPCILPNMMLKGFWTEERERALIAFYSEHQCLWRRKSENHNNRQLRLRLLEALRGQLSDHSVSFSVEDMKCKFKNLRTVFNREYKAVQAHRLSDRLYVSKWKHYQQLMFLCQACDQEHLMLQEDREVEQGNQTPSSSLSSSSSSSVQINTIKYEPSPLPSSEARTSSSIFLSAPPDEPPSQTPASPSTSLADTKPCSDAPPLHVLASVEPDSRLSMVPRCHWTEARVQQLISFYSGHSCLWNHRSESYRNRLLRQSLLETLSRLLSERDSAPFTVEDIKTKFRNLRTIFQREHKAMSSNRTCGSEDFYLPKWKHYGQLLFLCDSCDEDEPPEPPQVPLSSHHHDNQSASKLDITSGSHKAPPSPTPPDSQHSTPSSSPSSLSDSRVLGCKRGLQPPPSELLDIMRTFCQSQLMSPHAGFLKYVEECLNETPPDKVRKLKKKIIETIHSVVEED